MKKQQVAEKKRFPELMLELRVDFMSMNNINWSDSNLNEATTMYDVCLYADGLFGSSPSPLLLLELFVSWCLFCYIFLLLFYYYFVV